MHEQHPENQWIKEYQKGDVAALERLVEQFRRPLYAFIYNMLQGRGDAEEVFQEVWLRAIKNMNRYRERNFIGWLFRIARNLCVDHFRRQGRYCDPGGPPEDGPSPIEQFPDHRAGPDRNLANRDMGERIHRALATLPDDQREVFLLRTEGDLSFKDIAELQGISLNTALSRMHYALMKLRPLLAEEFNS